MKNTCKKEYGDFQTPIDLALDVCEKLKEMGVNPEIIIEPTCGTGSFIEAVFRKFEKCNKIIGIEINDKYIDSIKLKYKDNSKIDIINGNFFTFNWFKILNDINSSVLFLGNLPWVTNAEVGGLNGSNLPKKNNFQNITGFNAMMGESNFDISEWMLIKIIELVKFIPNNNVFIAFLIKTSVARRILNYMHKNNMPGSNINIFCIDAKKEFNVSVDACLFTCNFASKEYPINCSVFDNLHSLHPSNILGFRNNALVNDVKKAEKTEYLYSPNQKIWRSGIKHDCSSVMEFIIKEDGLYNGFNEKVELEDSYLFPLLKSSDIANGRVEIKRLVLVPQSNIGEETRDIENTSPKTWMYLNKYKHLLDKRKSIIYKNKPPFSIFGVGKYSFSYWKIAISGLYKNLNFKLIGPHHNKPVMFDDTVYFLPLDNRKQAEEIYSLLNTDEAKNFLTAHIFWDAKRPITTSILNKLNISKLTKINSFHPNEKTKMLLNIR